MCFKAGLYDLPSHLGSQWEKDRELLSRHQLLTRDPFIPISFEKLISHCSAKRIRSLNIEHTKLTDKEIPLFAKISTLEKLRLGPHCQIGDKGISRLAKLPLQTLSIAHAASITVKGFEQLSKMPLLQLTLGVGGKLTRPKLTQLFKLKQLTALDLGVISGVSITLARSRFPQLQHFNGRQIEGDKRHSFENLPVVVLVKVLNYLEHPVSDTRLRRTCRQLKSLPSPLQVNLNLGGETSLTTLLQKYPRKRICALKVHCWVTDFSPSISAILELPSLKKLSIRGFFHNDYKKKLVVQASLEELYLDGAIPLSTHDVVSWLWLGQLTKLQTFAFAFNDVNETASFRRLDHKMWNLLETLPLRKIKVAHLCGMLKDFKRALDHPTVKDISIGDSQGYSDTILQELLKTHKTGFAKLEQLEFFVKTPAMNTLEALLQLPLQELRIGGLSLDKGNYSSYVEKNPHWKGVPSGTFVRKDGAIFLDKEPTFLYKMYPGREDQHLFKHFSFMRRSKVGTKEEQLIVKPIDPQPVDPTYEISDVSFAIASEKANERLPSLQDKPILPLAPAPILSESIFVPAEVISTPREEPIPLLTPAPVLPTPEEVVTRAPEEPIAAVTPSPILPHVESETQTPPQEAQNPSGVIHYLSAFCRAIGSFFIAIYEWFRGLWQRV